MQLLDVGMAEVSSALSRISEIACPPYQTALNLMEQTVHKEDHGGHLPTGLKWLDEALCGGIPFGVLTELVGPPGIGKTQILFFHQICCLTRKKMSKQQQPSDQPPPSHSTDYAPYPKLIPHDIGPPLQPETWASVTIAPEPQPQPQSNQESPSASPPPPPAAIHVEERAPISADAATSMPEESNPYVAPPAPPPASSAKNKMDSVKDVLGKWGKKAAEATKKAEDLAGNMWQHLKTGPSFADAAVGRIAQGTKVLAEGGYEKIFRQNFETVPEEQLRKTYACYLSTSAGPVMGILYLSTAKLAFCSDSPLSYKTGDQTEWSYYKVVIPFHQLKAVNPSASKVNPAEKYIQVISIDNHEFWFMGFVHYDSAVKNLRGLLQPGSL